MGRGVPASVLALMSLPPHLQDHRTRSSHGFLPTNTTKQMYHLNNFAGNFSGPGRVPKPSNEMTSDPNIWHAGSPSPYLGRFSLFC